MRMRLDSHGVIAQAVRNWTLTAALEIQSFEMFIIYRGMLQILWSEAELFRNKKSYTECRKKYR